MLRYRSTAIILQLRRCKDMFAGTFTSLNNRQYRAERACLHMHSMQSRKMLTQIDWNSLDRVRRKITVTLNLLFTPIPVISIVIPALLLGFVHCAKVFAPPEITYKSNADTYIGIRVTPQSTCLSTLQHCNGSISDCKYAIIRIISLDSLMTLYDTLYMTASTVCRVEK